MSEERFTLRRPVPERALADHALTAQEVNAAQDAWAAAALADGLVPVMDACLNVRIERPDPYAKVPQDGETYLVVEGAVEPLTVCYDTSERLGGDDGLVHLFTYHAPQGPQTAQQHRAIREAGLLMARTIARLSPPCADQTAAIRAVREAVMWSNAAIATDGGP